MVGDQQQPVGRTREQLGPEDRPGGQIERGMAVGGHRGEVSTGRMDGQVWLVRRRVGMGAPLPVVQVEPQPQRVMGDDDRRQRSPQSLDRDRRLEGEQHGLVVVFGVRGLEAELPLLDRRQRHSVARLVLDRRRSRPG